MLAAYLVGISIAIISLGLLLDWLLGASGIALSAQLGEGGELVPAWLAWASGVILILLAVGRFAHSSCAEWDAGAASEVPPEQHTMRQQMLAKRGMRLGASGQTA